MCELPRGSRDVRGPLSANQGVSRIRGSREAVNSCALTLATCLLASTVYFISQSVNRKTLRRPAGLRHRSAATSTYVSRYTPCSCTATQHAASVPVKLMALSPETHSDRSRRDGQATLKNPRSDLGTRRLIRPRFPDVSKNIFATLGTLEVLVVIISKFCSPARFHPRRLSLVPQIQ